MFWFATFLWFCVEYFDILSGKTSSGHKQGRHYNHEYLRSARKWINVFIYISPVTHNYWQLIFYFKVVTLKSLDTFKNADEYHIPQIHTHQSQSQSINGK